MKQSTPSPCPTKAQDTAFADSTPFEQRQIGLTELQAAIYLGLKVYTLRKWRREGTGPAYIRAGARLIRYEITDLDAWLEKNKFNSKAHELSLKSTQ